MSTKKSTVYAYNPRNNTVGRITLAEEEIADAIEVGFGSKMIFFLLEEPIVKNLNPKP